MKRLLTLAVLMVLAGTAVAQDAMKVVKSDGLVWKEHPVFKGSMVHIPPGVVHGAKGRMRVLVIGIPDISDDDLFFP